MVMNRLGPAVIVATAFLAACGGDSDAPANATTAVAETTDRATTTVTTDDQRFPEILDAQATSTGDDTWTFAVTISSPYDTPQRYADAWRVLGVDGTEYGLRILTHDHAAEQPFTRSLAGVEIPDGVDQVLIEARDLVNGWSGTTFELALPVS